MSAKEIAEYTETHSRRYEKILRHMTKWGWLSSKRGPRGGYEIARVPTLGEAYAKTQPPSRYQIIDQIQAKIRDFLRKMPFDYR